MHRELKHPLNPLLSLPRWQSSARNSCWLALLPTEYCGLARLRSTDTRSYSGALAIASARLVARVLTARVRAPVCFRDAFVTAAPRRPAERSAVQITFAPSFSPMAQCTSLTSGEVALEMLRKPVACAEL